MGSFTFTQSDGSKRTVGGYQYAPCPDSAKHFDASRVELDHLPHKVDLRYFMTPVEDQEQTSSCAANATAGAYEYLVKRYKGDDGYDVSRLFIYYNARYIATPDGIGDDGSQIYNNIEGLKQYGAPSEASWPFDKDQINTEPSGEVYREAAEFVIEDTESVPTDLVAWKTALAMGHPIIFACRLYSSFQKPRKPGHVEMPTARELQGDGDGGHAMLCVGYSDPDQVFIVRNSWGTSWGINGYCYIPYRYLMDPALNWNDSWIIERLETIPPDEEHCWADDDETILEDVAGVLAGFDEEQWADLMDRMGETPLEVRLALLFLKAAGADGEVADEEWANMAEHLVPVLEQLGTHPNADALLHNTFESFNDDELVDETIALFGEFFATDVLASITAQLQETIGSDGEAHEEEQAFVDRVISEWQVGGDEAEAEEEEAEEEAAEEKAAYDYDQEEE
ncbi:hypothetical protein MAPG_09811 [Magnaporthiopsis poae ATCC 64411]|uniref:Peptidase C1A papain C-terminal domain-containing protein n=1 Tax=Magnaporthiopsis poae (strain ATCC 64411 / 73-15) TaxID=644358 RepID=A0A0C4EAX4_MAGP6|nr:hypothetical protein MAPG_09811 [Magnaporthiopsis poae ATCC 64411]